MKTLIILAIFLGLGFLALALTELRERRKPKDEMKKQVRVPVDDECCGTHAVCERELLLQKSTEIEYYDDEELDVLADKAPTEYTAEQLNQLDEVFRTLKEKDVAGWLRSLQTRRIELPENLKEEALFIVSERRKA